MILETKCKNCQEKYILNTLNPRGLWNYDCCSEPCNREYFETLNIGVIPISHLKGFAEEYNQNKLVPFKYPNMSLNQLLNRMRLNGENKNV